MVLVGIGMLVVGVLLGGFLIYLWTRPKPAPLPEPAPTVPLDVERVRALQWRDEDEVFDRMGEVFDRMDDGWHNLAGTMYDRPTSRRQRLAGMFQTRTTTVTRTPATSSATPPSVPAQAQPSVTLFDHLSKEDDDLL